MLAIPDETAAVGSSRQRPSGKHARLAGVLLAAAAGLALSACEEAKLEVSEGTGPNPTLPPPDSSFIPTVNVADATGWLDGGKPTAAEGLSIAAFADGL